MKNAAVLAMLGLVLACGGASEPIESTAAKSASATEGGEATAPQPPDGDLSVAVAGDQRSPENKARDRDRHPVETLTFFGIEPDMHVLEVTPGRGWYTEILAPYLMAEGRLTVGVPSADGRRANYRQTFMDMKAERPEIFSKVDVATFDPPSPIDLGPDETVDLVLTFRNTHNWIVDRGEHEAYAALFAVLRPGGVLGVVQHRAADGTDASETAKTGYVPEAYVIAIAEEAGFELVGRSEVNRNEKDDHDHPEGVWTLPPVLRLGDKDQARYIEIGESDRMTLKFRKPGTPK